MQPPMSPAALDTDLSTRADNHCELCGAQPDAGPYQVPASPTQDVHGHILLCTTCHSQLSGDAPLDTKHLFCLQEAAWSHVPAVQVVSWRLLTRLSAETWAHDLLEQIYLEEDVLQWAKAGLNDADDDHDVSPTLDCNGTRLQDGDSVTLIKALDVKGANFTAKQGTLVKNIRLTDNPEHVDGRVNKVAIVLKTCFLKKATEKS
jgi:protein PhnA